MFVAIPRGFARLHWTSIPVTRLSLFNEPNRTVTLCKHEDIRRDNVMGPLVSATRE